MTPSLDVRVDARVADERNAPGARLEPAQLAPPEPPRARARPGRTRCRRCSSPQAPAPAASPGIARQRSGATAPIDGDRVAAALADADEVRDVPDAHHARRSAPARAASPPRPWRRPGPPDVHGVVRRPGQRVRAEIDAVLADERPRVEPRVALGDVPGRAGHPVAHARAASRSGSERPRRSRSRACGSRRRTRPSSRRPAAPG